MAKYKLTDIEIVKAKKPTQSILMVDPQTGEEVEAATPEEAQMLMENGYTPKEEGFADGGIVLKSKNLSMSESTENDKLTTEQKLTGQYIDQVPTHQLVDAQDEVEDNEFLQFPNQEIREAYGERHEQGGVSLNLESGTKILSDNLTVGKEMAKALEKEHGIKVNKDTTFAETLSKYNNKIGLDKLNKEQEDLFTVLKKQERIKDDKTKETNLNYLNEKIYNIEKKKNTLKEEQKAMFDKLFSNQETQKSNTTFEDGGEKVDPRMQYLADKYGVTTERAMFLLGGMKTKYANGAEVKKYYDENGNEIPAAVVYNYNKRLAEEEAIATANQEPIPATKGTVTQATTSLDAPYGTEEAFTTQGINRLNLKMVGLGLSPIPTNASKEQVISAVNTMQNYGVDTYPELVEDYALNRAKPTNKHGEIIKQINKDKGTNYQNTNEDLKKALAAGDITNEQLRSGYADGKWWYRGLTTTKQKVSPEELAKLKAERGKDFIESGGIGYLPSDTNPDEYVQYYTDEPATEAEAEAAVNNPRGDENIYDSPKPALRTGAKGFIFPDQSVLPPNPLEAHLLINNRRQRIDPVKVGIEDNLTEVNRQSNAVMGQLNTLPPSQRAAAMASLLTTTQRSANTAITNANKINAQNQQNAELFNIRQADAEDTMRGNNLRQFEALQLTAKANTDKDLRDYFDHNRNVALNNLRNQQTLNMIEVMSPDYSLDLFGNAVNFDPSYNYQVDKNKVK